MALDLERLGALWGRRRESFADSFAFDSAYEDAFPELFAAAKSVSALIEERDRLRAALVECQSVLAMLTDPDARKQSTVINAWAAAVAAEQKARAALSGEGK